jgi:hypothetical protein
MSICNFSLAQQITYSYDLSGNREGRVYSSPRLANPALTKDSISIVEKKYGIVISPNPTPDKLNVFISTLADGETANINVSDAEGRNLATKVQTARLEALDLSHLRAGIYYIRIYIRKESVSYKIVRL